MIVLIAAALFYHSSDTPYYVHAGASSDPAHRKLNVGTALLAEAIIDAQQHGLTKADLYGIAPDGADKNHPWLASPSSSAHLADTTSLLPGLGICHYSAAATGCTAPTKRCVNTPSQASSAVLPPLFLWYNWLGNITAWRDIYAYLSEFSREKS